jgi:hypothetical protein
MYLVLSGIGQAKDQMDCSLLHNGTFLYGDTSNPTKVVIEGTNHTEYHGKYIIKSEIKWVNDCEFNMTMTKVTIPNFPYRPGDVMNVKVDKVEGKMIYYTSTVKENNWKGVMVKIE